MESCPGFILLIIAALSSPTTARAQSKSSGHGTGQKSQIVFVCEHGAALSVVSAAYFNKIAGEEHLNLHAIARGTAPQKELAVSAREGLKADGVSFVNKRPAALSTSDAAQARQIVSFCPIPAKYSKLAPVETWNDVPPTGANYQMARDAILRHLKELVARMKAEAAKP